MKMNFHQRNNTYISQNNKKNIFVPTSIVIFFILIFSFSWTKNILFKTGAPLWIVKNSVNSFFTGNIRVLNSKLGLLKENSLLKDQIERNQKDQTLLEILKNENDDLKNILDRKKSDQKLLLASVLVKPFLSAYDTLLIDVGSYKGVSVGDKVLADGDTFIGYISEVYSNTSKVVLYSSSGEKIRVLISDNNIEKEAVGLGGGNFKVEMPREIEVKEGDIITIPSISTNIFGTVERIEFKESDSFQSILFKNPANMSEVKWVEVLLTNKN